VRLEGLAVDEPLDLAAGAAALDLEDQAVVQQARQLPAAAAADAEAS
jgi:hypothetical protein